MATIDGIVSGLRTGELIDSLITLQAGQQTLLAQKKTSTSSLVSALQSLNTKVASLAEHAAKAAKAESWAAVKGQVKQTGTTGAVGATVTVGERAQAGTLSFRVDAVAQSQASLVTLPPLAADATPTFTVTRGGETTTVTAVSGSVPDIVDAFNARGTGVRATAVRVDVLDADGKATGESTYRLQLTGAETGAAHAFTVQLDGADVALEPVRAARDASLTLFPGTSAAQTLTSSTNTFTGVMTGVDLTVTAATAADAADLVLDVTRDESAAKSLAQGLVSNISTVLSEITSRTRSTTSTAADGGSIVRGGLFSGDTTVRLLQQNVIAQASMPVDGVAPADVGIVLGKDGTVTFDDAVFTAAMAKDPEQVATVLQGVAARLADTAKVASDPLEGTLTTAVTAHQDTVKDLTTRIAQWDDRLAARRLSLERLYASLETTMSGLQGQANYLASYLSSTTNGSKS